MISPRELSLERDGFSLRELGMLLVSVIIVAGAAAFVLAQGRETFPAGSIGYRADDVEAWVNATGEPAEAPEAWAPPQLHAAYPQPELGPAQFPSPDGRAIAYVNTTDEGAWLVSRLMVREGDVITEVGQLGGGDSPSLVLGGKGGARSQNGVPLLVSWSPDGQTLAWGSVMEPPYNLQLGERGSWKTRSLPLEGGYAGELAWAPGGRRLAISTYAEDRTDHTILLLDTARSGPPQRVAKGCVMVWSPDGQHLALHGEPRTQPGLWVVSVDGGARQVMDRLGVAPFAWVE
jgi:WD40-like Beta Propeller Repeat